MQKTVSSLGLAFGFFLAHGAAQGASLEVVLTAAGTQITGPLAATTCFAPGRALVIGTSHTSPIVWKLTTAQAIVIWHGRYPGLGEIVANAQDEIQQTRATHFAAADRIFPGAVEVRLPAETVQLSVHDENGQELARADFEPVSPSASCLAALDETAYRTAHSTHLRVAMPSFAPGVDLPALEFHEAAKPDAGAWMCQAFGYSRCVYPGQAPQPHLIVNPAIQNQLGIGIRF